MCEDSRWVFTDPLLFPLASHPASFILGWMSVQSSTFSLSVSCLWSPTRAFYVSALISAHMRDASCAHLRCLESEICQSQFTLCERDCSMWGGGVWSVLTWHTVGPLTKNYRLVRHHMCRNKNAHIKSAFGHLKDSWSLCYVVSCSAVSLISLLRVALWTVPWEFLAHGSSLLQLVPIIERHSLVRHSWDIFVYKAQLHMNDPRHFICHDRLTDTNI